MTTYRAESRTAVTDGVSEFDLETAAGATPEGQTDHPELFTGFVSSPEVLSAGLLAVADVAATRYFDVASVRARSLDPVVTASGDRLRFESFSADNGVHARLDLLSGGIDAGTIGFGTTNVDLNLPIRAALGRMGRGQLMRLAVGADTLHISTLTEHHVERAVEMPERWIRGFAETPTIAAGMTHRGEIQGSAIRTFLTQLPPGRPGPTLQVEVSQGSVRRAARASPTSVNLAGTGRLVTARRIARFATVLDIYGTDDGASGWVFTLPGARLTLLLTAAPFRGFSGEGGLLFDLVTSDAELASRVAEQLAWEPVIDVAVVAAESGLSDSEVRRGISRLATSGHVGFDLAEQAWFHRELPDDPDRVVRDNPRLRGARLLSEADAVRASETGWIVTVGDSLNYVDIFGSQHRCSCLWWARHAGSRGPCKHVLAVWSCQRSGSGVVSALSAAHIDHLSSKPQSTDQARVRAARWQARHDPRGAACRRRRRGRGGLGGESGLNHQLRPPARNHPCPGHRGRRTIRICGRSLL